MSVSVSGLAARGITHRWPQPNQIATAEVGDNLDLGGSLLMGVDYFNPGLYRFGQVGFNRLEMLGSTVGIRSSTGGRCGYLWPWAAIGHDFSSLYPELSRCQMVGSILVEMDVSADPEDGVAIALTDADAAAVPPAAASSYGGVQLRRTGNSEWSIETYSDGAVQSGAFPMTWGPLQPAVRWDWSIVCIPGTVATMRMTVQGVGTDPPESPGAVGGVPRAFDWGPITPPALLPPIGVNDRYCPSFIQNAATVDVTTRGVVQFTFTE